MALNCSEEVASIAFWKFVRKLGDDKISPRTRGIVFLIISFIMSVGSAVSYSVWAGCFSTSGAVFLFRLCSMRGFLGWMPLMYFHEVRQPTGGLV